MGNHSFNKKILTPTSKALEPGTELAALKSLSLITLLSLGQHKALSGGGAPSLPAAPWAQTPQNSSPGRYHGAEVGQLTRGARRTAVTQENDRTKGRLPPRRPVTAGSPRRPPGSAASAPAASQKRAGEARSLPTLPRSAVWARRTPNPQGQWASTHPSALPFPVPVPHIPTDCAGRRPLGVE